MGGGSQAGDLRHCASSQQAHSSFWTCGRPWKGVVWPPPYGATPDCSRRHSTEHVNGGVHLVCSGGARYAPHVRTWPQGDEGTRVAEASECTTFNRRWISRHCHKAADLAPKTPPSPPLHPITVAVSRSLHRHNLNTNSHIMKYNGTPNEHLKMISVVLPQFVYTEFNF